MKTRVLRVIQVFFKSAALKFIKELSKLSRTILKLKSQTQKSMNKSAHKQENPLQEETEEISRRIGEPTVDPQPSEPPTPVRLEEEISRRIGEPTVSPQPPKPPSPIRVRKTGVATVTKQPPKPPRPLR
jgi:hypothetical protein